MGNRIPSSFIDELLARVDIVEVIDSRVPLRRAGKDYQACCPFHEERTPSFTVSSNKQFYHCFGCGAHGSAIGFLMQHEGLTFPEAVAELAGRAGLAVPSEVEGVQRREAQHAALIEVLERARGYFQRQLREPAGQPAVEYLKGRGVTGEIAAAFGLGFAPDAWNGLETVAPDRLARDALVEAGLTVRRDGREYDRFRGRLMFPIEDYRGRLIGFGGRVIGAGEPKYLNSPETPLFHKGRELYGLFRAREAIRRASQVIVVEGYMDVIALAQFGVENVVATLGTAMSAEQFERLFRFAPEVVLCFDGDRAGQAAAWRAVETAMGVLREGRQVSFLFLPERDDPDSFIRTQGAEALQARLKKLDPLPEFFFRTLSAKTDLARLDGRAKLVELARPLLSKLSPGVFRTMMLNQLSVLARTPSSGLAREWRLGEADPRAEPSGLVTRPRGTAQPSAVRLALALLIQHPGIADQAGPIDELRGFERRSVRLLCTLIDHLQAEPAANTGMLLERFADSPYLPTLAELASFQHVVLEQDPGPEFMGLLQRVREQAVRQRRQSLLEKSGSPAGLTPEEWAELRRLGKTAESRD